MSSAISMVIVVAAVTLFPLFYFRWSKIRHVKTLKNGFKVIDLKGLFFCLGLIPILLFGSVGIMIIGFTEQPIAGFGFIVMGLLLSSIAAPFLLKDTSFRWNNEFIEGPKSEWSFKKTVIRWDEVVSVENIQIGGARIKGKNGNSIFLTYYLSGWFEVIRDLRKLRPDLDTSDFDNP